MLKSCDFIIEKMYWKCWERRVIGYRHVQLNAKHFSFKSLFDQMFYTRQNCIPAWSKIKLEVIAVLFFLKDSWNNYITFLFTEPSAPQDLRLEEENIQTVIVNFSAPALPNGDISEYIIRYSGVKVGILLFCQFPSNSKVVLILRFDTVS